MDCVVPQLHGDCATVQHSEPQHITVSHSTGQWATAQRSERHHSTVSHCTAQWATAQWATTQHSESQHLTVSHSNAQWATAKLFSEPQNHCSRLICMVCLWNLWPQCLFRQMWGKSHTYIIKFKHLNTSVFRFEVKYAFQEHYMSLEGT